MGDRSILCWVKCCGKPPSQETDDGEWIEPISKRTKNKRHVSNIGQNQSMAGGKKIGNRSLRSVNSRASDDSGGDGELENRQTSIHWADELNDNDRQPSIRWSDMINDGINKEGAGKRSSLCSFDTALLDCPEYDQEVYKSVNSDDFLFQSAKQSWGDIDVPVGDSFNSARGSSNSRMSDISMISEGGEGDLEGNGEEGEGDPEGNKVHKSAAGKIARRTMAVGRKFKSQISSEMRQSRFTLKMPSVGNRLTTFTTGSLSSTATGESINPAPKKKPITAIAVLGDDCILTASRSDRVIKMFKTIPSDAESCVEFVQEFRGHNSGITALTVLDKKGRFLSAGTDKTVRLWDSRFECEEVPKADERASASEPRTLLSVFSNHARWVHSIEVLDEGSYVRPTDDIDSAMITAMARKTLFNGASSVQRAAIQREIIECSGSIATASKNDSTVSIWGMILADKKEEEPSHGASLKPENVAELNLLHELDHEASIQAMAAQPNMIITGDVMGDVFLWEHKRGSFAMHKNWTRTRKFTPWKDGQLRKPGEITKQSVLKLCFLNDGLKFVAGLECGKIRVWDTDKKADVVHRKEAKSVKITSESFTGIQTLPDMKDPQTGQVCLAFSVASTDGRVVSMAMHPQVAGTQPSNHELVIVDMIDYSAGEEDEPDSKNVPTTDNSIHSIAVSETVLIAGDGNGTIQISMPEWNKESEIMV